MATRGRPRLWTGERLAELDDLTVRGWSDARLGAHFGGISVDRIKAVRHDYGLGPRCARWLSADRVTRKLLGIRGSTTVLRWCRRRWLRSRVNRLPGGRRRWEISEEWLYEFVADATHWHRWHPDRITDAALRDYARELRAEYDAGRWLTLQEVGERLHYSEKTVHKWAQTGRLPADYRCRRWWVREEALREFTPHRPGVPTVPVPPANRCPVGRPKGSPNRAGGASRQFTPEESAWLAEWRGAGQPFRALAVALDRAASSVRQHYRQFVEPKLKQARRVA